MSYNPCDEMLYFCDTCGKLCDEVTVYDVDGDALCEKCMPDGVFVASACDHIIDKTSDPYIVFDDETYCMDCGIHQYRNGKLV